jgi:hypothetical protein
MIATNELGQGAQPIGKPIEAASKWAKLETGAGRLKTIQVSG